MAGWRTTKDGGFMDLRLLVPFRRDARVAHFATGPRKAVFWGTSAGFLVVLALYWSGAIPDWTLWLAWSIDLGIFTVLGNAWADQDALAAVEDDRRV